MEKIVNPLKNMLAETTHDLFTTPVSLCAKRAQNF